jgi:hypothetical protein
MKKLALIVTFSLISCWVKAQTDKIPEPEFVNVPAVYISSTKVLTCLPSETVTSGMRPGKSFYEIKGIASTVKLNAADDNIFIIKAGDSDPSTMLTLYRMDVTRKSRQSQSLSLTLFSGSNGSPDIIPFSLQKISDKLYRIVISKTLPKGEYMFMATMTGYTASAIAYTFGIY